MGGVRFNTRIIARFIAALSEPHHTVLSYSSQGAKLTAPEPELDGVLCKAIALQDDDSQGVESGHSDRYCLIEKIDCHN